MIRPAQLNGRSQRKMMRRDFAHSPLLVFYEVTQACDLACTHCRACAQPEPHRSELTTEQALRLIEQLTTFPIPPMLVLTGGDPLKRRDLFDLIEHAVWAGLDVSITPSPTRMVTREAICRLRNAGISRMAISIDGADARTNDAMRGVPGSFVRSLQILANARDAGIPTQVNTTLTPRNVGQIDRMADLLSEQGIVMWSVFFLVPVGRARGARRLSAAECEMAFGRIWHQAQRQPYHIKTTEAPHYRRFAILNQILRTGKHPAGQPTAYVPSEVNDGKGVMFIGHSGMICPSGFMPIVCGVFPVENVVEVYQNSNIFRALRDTDQLEGKCKICEFRHICGGSRARAYAVTGNPFAQEPDCAYVPSAIKQLGVSS